MNQDNCRGTITLEACIMVPMFIAVMLLVNGLFIMNMGQQIISHALIQCSKSLAFDPYASQRVAANTKDDLADMFVDIFTIGHTNYVSTDKWYINHPDDITDLVKDRFSVYVRESRGNTNYLLEEIGIEGGIDGLDFSGSVYENGILKISVVYRQNYLFDALGMASFQRKQEVQVKVFEYK